MINVKWCDEPVVGSKRWMFSNCNIQTVILMHGLRGFGFGGLM
jgi:hypothetical protein